MRHAPFRVALALGLGLAATAIAQTPSVDKDKDADVLEPIVRLAKAFNAKDAMGLAQAWTDDAELIDEDTGERLEGRKAIVADYTKALAKAKEFRLEIDVLKVRRHSSDAATVEGAARVLRPEEPISRSTFVAVLVRQKGAWRIASVRERGEPTNDAAADILKELAWLNGTWRHQNGDTEIELECTEVANGNFRVNRYRVKTRGEVTHEGTQIVGYDPAKNQLRAWVFSSDGSFGDGTVLQDEKRITFQVSGVLPSGDKSLATQIITRKGADAFSFQVVDRHIGAHTLPDVPPITLTKQAAATSKGDGQ